jgi:type 1 fimbria pilin
MEYKKIQSIMGGFLLLMMTSSQAHDGTVNIDGAITDNTCTVSPGSVDFTVSLGNVSSKQFKHAGDASRFEPFAIHLENCGSGVKGVSTIFYGPQDSLNSNLLSVTSSGPNTAAGLGIGIYNENKSLIPLSSESDLTPLIPGQTLVSLNFLARYVANGVEVIAGQANASATFVLKYA